MTPINSTTTSVVFDGTPLAIEDVVAVEKILRGMQLTTSPAFRARITRSADFLDRLLTARERSWILYEA